MVETPDLKYRFFVTHRALVLARDYAFEALALAVVVLTQSDIWTNVDENRIRVAAIALFTAGALLFRRRAPFVVPLAVASGAVAFTLLDPTAAYETDTMFLVLILAAWAAGSLLDARQALIALGALLVAGWTVFIRAPDVPLTELIWLSIPVVGTFVLSAATARHSERARLAEQRMLEAEEVARRAVEDERSRITRELHDVLAHSVSVMTVQASAVRRLLKPEQEREREALMTVEETGRQALAEMRRLLGIMRTEAEPAALAPQPGIGTLPELVEQVRQSGLPVELTVEGTPVKLPAGVDLSAYRIVQEALTNTLRHAGPAHAWVAVRYAGEDVEIEVANDGNSDNPGDGSGHGLVGMRERVALCGGELESGPRPGRRLQDLRAPSRRRRCGMSIRVLIVDDQALVRAGFKMILESEPEIEIVGEAEDGLQAVETARELRPDVVLMDIRMPNLDGLEATRRILDTPGEAPRILMLTTFDLDEYVYEALRAGASGFMLKDTPPEQLVAAIHVVASGDALLSPAITKRVIEEFIRRPPSSIATAPSPKVAELTARELEVLGFMARGLSNAEIARDLFVSETTVKTHVARILMKLDLRDRVQAVVFAYETGIVQPGGSDAG